ncbi:arrestin domain-containing protein 3-like isoform X2 [Mercenaria mercenaria]|uniref:arrestin domain-containing protein 3-like isoform X2 n=1 Tax=Mercenaria mercenaria TaxID=6596 RepID=UPI00234E8AB0|nr:arrestin domain-containing protein 3-like isoform X2 [Mercenaria mercenaria]
MGQRKVVEEFSVTLQSRPSVHGPIYMTADTVKGHVRLEILQHLSLTYDAVICSDSAQGLQNSLDSLETYCTKWNLTVNVAISITIKGQGYVHWTEQKLRGPGEPRFKDTHHHSASEDYFEHTLVLFGQGTGERPDKCYLPAGRYTYPFQCQLPAKLPCSFEGELGYVRYWVKATIEKGRELIHKTKLPFTVICPLELNSVPDSDTPVQESTEKNMCCWCCLSGPISASLCLPKRGFVPGEPIRFAVEVSNLSSRQMGCCSVELKMTALYKTTTMCRSTTKQICKVKRDRKFGRGESITWFCDQLVIPPVPPSCLIGCSIISIKYTLELRVDPVGPAFDLTLPIEIIVGTLPHRARTDLHHYANISYQRGSKNSHSRQDVSSRNSQHSNPPQNTRARNNKQNSSTHDLTSNSSQHSRETDTPVIQRQPIGVPVLPMQGGKLMVNPAQSLHQSNQTMQQSQGASQSPRDPVRPSSRASSAPSTNSASSAHSIRISAIFAESAFGRQGLRFEDGSESGNGRVKFAPLYPYYLWR